MEEWSHRKKQRLEAYLCRAHFKDRSNIYSRYGNDFHGF